MTNEQKQVKDWMQAFGQETPEKPTIPSLEVRRLRAKLILEEALETIDALGFDVLHCETDHEKYYLRIDNIEFETLKVSEKSLAAIADGCSDLSVVNYGTLVACGLVQENKAEIDDEGNDVYVEKDPLFAEVMRSNWTKLWTTTEVNQKVVTDGDSPAFDATAIIAANTLCDEEGNTYKAVGNDKWLVKDSDGKVIKSPSYSPANLTPIINGLSS